MTYNPHGQGDIRKAYDAGYNNAQYFGENFNTYDFKTQPGLYEQYERGFNDWFNEQNDYEYQRVQTTLRGWCTNAI